MLSQLLESDVELIDDLLDLNDEDVLGLAEATDMGSVTRKRLTRAVIALREHSVAHYADCDAIAH